MIKIKKIIFILLLVFCVRQSFIIATQLHEAAKQGNVDQIKNLISKIPDPNQKTTFVNERDDDGFTALHRAADRGHADAIQALVDNEADVAAIIENEDEWNHGMTALHLAAGRGHVHVINTILNSIEDSLQKIGFINLRNKDGWTVLHWAVAMNKIESIQAIISTVENPYQRAELVNATINNPFNKYYGWTTLHTAVASQDFWNQNVTIILSLLVNGADLFARTSDGLTALHLAVSMSYVNVIYALVTSILNPEQKAYFVNMPINNSGDWNHGWTALHLAVASQDPLNQVINAIIQFLVASGADVNAVINNPEYKHNQWTSLHFAVERQDYNVIQTLLNVGAQIPEDLKTYLLPEQQSFQSTTPSSQPHFSPQIPQIQLLKQKMIQLKTLLQTLRQRLETLQQKLTQLKDRLTMMLQKSNPAS